MWVILNLKRLLEEWFNFQIKRYAANLLEIDTAVEEESRARADIEDQVATSERKGSLK